MESDQRSSVPTLTLGSLSGPDASARNSSILIICVLDSRSFDDLLPGIKRSIQNTNFLVWAHFLRRTGIHFVGK